MSLFNRLPGFPATAPGWERTYLTHLPGACLFGSVALSLPSLLARMGSDAVHFRTLAEVDIWVVSLLVFYWTVIFTSGLLAIIVMVAKGPGYVADAYALNDADAPATNGNARSARPRGEP